MAGVDTRPTDEQYFAEREAQLREEMNAGFPEAWKPQEAGETLIGLLVAQDVGHTAKYGMKKIAVLENPKTKERKAIWLMHTALVSQFQRAAPLIGELVAVRYDGKQQSQGGDNEYDGWTVRVDRPKNTVVDWSPIGEAPAQAGRRATDASVVPTGAAADFGDDSDIPF